MDFSGCSGIFRYFMSSQPKSVTFGRAARAPRRVATAAESARSRVLERALRVKFVRALARGGPPDQGRLADPGAGAKFPRSRLPAGARQVVDSAPGARRRHRFRARSISALFDVRAARLRHPRRRQSPTLLTDARRNGQLAQSARRRSRWRDSDLRLRSLRSPDQSACDPAHHDRSPRRRPSDRPPLDQSSPGQR